MDWLSTEDEGEAGWSSHRVKVVHFENLQDMLQWNLLSILDFLSLRPDPGRIECLLKHEEGLFRRKSKGSQAVQGPTLLTGASGNSAASVSSRGQWWPSVEWDMWQTQGVRSMWSADF